MAMQTFYQSEASCDLPTTLNVISDVNLTENYVAFNERLCRIGFGFGVC